MKFWMHVLLRFWKSHLFLLLMQEGTWIESCFLNELSKIDEEDQAFLLLCSLPPYMSFRKGIIYRGEQSFKVKEFKGELAQQKIKSIAS